MMPEREQCGVERRRWLCVAYSFPPINRSGTHRTLGFVRHLDRLGWDATVLTVAVKTEPVDPALGAHVPPSTRLVQTEVGDPIALVKKLPLLRRRCSVDLRPSARRAPSAESSAARCGLREWVSCLLQTPDSKTGWIPGAVSAGLRAIRRDRPGVIYSTSPYVSAHLVAMILKWRTGLPWVADFRDPWCDNPFFETRFESIRRVHTWLEDCVCRTASHVVMNTQPAREALCRRRPPVAAKCSVIPNGIDYDLLKAIEPMRIIPREVVALTHCGQFYGSRTPQPWFAALRRLHAESPAIAERVRLVLVGGEDYHGVSLRNLAEQAGVADLVLVTGRKSHRDSLAIMAGSDALALATGIGAGSELQIPNKLYEYLGVGRPLVAAVDRSSPVRSILNNAAPHTPVCEPGDEVALARAIRRCATQAIPEPSAPAIEKLDRKHRAASLVRLFDGVTGCAPAPAVGPWGSDAVEKEGVGGSLALDGRLGTVPG